MNNTELKLEMDRIRQVYFRRMAGEKELWSSATRCLICGDWWMWGVKDNLDFICSKHKHA